MTYFSMVTIGDQANKFDMITTMSTTFMKYLIQNLSIYIFILYILNTFNNKMLIIFWIGLEMK